LGPNQVNCSNLRLPIRCPATYKWPFSQCSCIKAAKCATSVNLQTHKGSITVPPYSWGSAMSWDHCTCTGTGLQFKAWDPEALSICKCPYTFQLTFIVQHPEVMGGQESARFGSSSTGTFHLLQPFPWTKKDDKNRHWESMLNQETAVQHTQWVTSHSQGNGAQLYW
jgi:hypothetical protein